MTRYEARIWIRWYLWVFLLCAGSGAVYLSASPEDRSPTLIVRAGDGDFNNRPAVTLICELSRPASENIEVKYQISRRRRGTP